MRTEPAHPLAVAKMAEQAQEPDQFEDAEGDGAEDDEPHSDDDEDDLQKPAWVGYFRLPKKDVQLGKPFLPIDE